MRTSKRIIEFYVGVCLVMTGAALSGCGNQINCAVLGDNARGRVTYASAVEVRQNVDVVVEWSTNSFSTVMGRIKERNVHGLLSIPYSMCVDSNVTYQVRAYADYNQNSVIDTGEPSGRMDGTASGNATYTSKQMPTYTKERDDWTIQEGIDVVVDMP